MHIGNNWYTGIVIGWVTALLFYLFRKLIVTWTRRGIDKVESKLPN